MITLQTPRTWSQTPLFSQISAHLTCEIKDFYFETLSFFRTKKIYFTVMKKRLQYDGAGCSQHRRASII